MNPMQNAHALVVGIAHYPQVNHLPDSVLHDAREIHKLLVASDYCDYPEKNARLLLDSQATKNAILDAMNDLAADTTDESVVFLYFSSHGGRVISGPKPGEYLLPFDTQLERDPGGRWQPCPDTAISSTEFTTVFEKINAHKVIVIFDCCYAGGIAKDGSSDEDRQPAFDKGFSADDHQALAQGRGWAILMASRATEQSYIMRGDTHSLFTKHLLEGLRGGIESDDALVHIFQLFEYVGPRVTGECFEQHPNLKARLEENFPVARYLGGRKGVSPKNKEEDGFAYDVYISYADREPDVGWVWDDLIPHLRAKKLTVAVSGDVEKPGAALVMEIDRAIRRSRRTVIVLSDNYLDDNLGYFRTILAYHLAVTQRRARLFPVIYQPFDRSRLPSGLEVLTMLDLTHPRLGQAHFARLPDLLAEPVIDL